jgi:hypothetical protein
MANIKENVEELNNMILNGQILEAFDKFYAPEIIMQDNETPAREGAQTCRDFEQSFIDNLTLAFPWCQGAPGDGQRRCRCSRYRMGL